MASAALDLDAILKAACYGWVDTLPLAVPTPPHTYGILGTARFVLPKKLRRRELNDPAAAAEALEHALQVFEVLEPSDREIILAAELEHAATEQDKPVHGGESLLCAMLVSRGLSHVLTGDKTAIAGLARMVLPAQIPLVTLEGRWVCFEQAVLWLCGSLSAAAVREAICAEPHADTALRLCFSCAFAAAPEASWLEGLRSHIQALRVDAGVLLMAGPD